MSERNSKRVGIIDKAYINGVLTYIVTLEEEVPMLFVGVENRPLVVHRTDEKGTRTCQIGTTYKHSDKSQPATPLGVGVSYFMPILGTISELAPSAPDSDSETTTETSE